MGEPLKFPNLLQMATVGAGNLASGFSPSRHLAELCDHFQPELNFAARVAQGQSVALLIRALPTDVYDKLAGHFGAKVLEELISLEKECDRELFFTGLLNVAGRLSQQPATVLAAAGIYHRVEASAPNREMTGLAIQRRLALEGVGNFGAKAEHTLRILGQEFGDYRNLAGALAGSTLASGIYKFTICRRGMLIHRLIQTQGLGHATFEAASLRIKARMAAMVAGSIGGSLTDRGLRTVLGQPVSWEPSAILADSAAMTVNLSAWRIASKLSNAYALRALAATRQPVNPLWKDLEIFGFRLASTASFQGAAMLLNQQLFDQRPESRGAAFGQTMSRAIGMNIGGLAGVRVVRFSH